MFTTTRLLTYSAPYFCVNTAVIPSERLAISSLIQKLDNIIKHELGVMAAATPVGLAPRATPTLYLTGDSTMAKSSDGVIDG